MIAPAPLAGLGGPYLEALQGAGFEPVYPKKRNQMTEAELLDHLSGISASVAGSNSGAFPLAMDLRLRSQ